MAGRERGLEAQHTEQHYMLKQAAIRRALDMSPSSSDAHPDVIKKGAATVAAI